MPLKIVFEASELVSTVKDGGLRSSSCNALRNDHLK